MHHFGSGIWSHILRTTHAILYVTVPATIIKSDCLGEKRNTSEPNRDTSYLDAAKAIISIAQHEIPIGIGQTAFFRAQLIIEPIFVVKNPSDCNVLFKSLIFFIPANAGILLF
jgi:hypothetical protein